MNYIQQAFNYKHDFWRYLVGSLLVFIASAIGQIPFTIAVFYKAFKEGKELTALNPNDIMGVLEPNLNLFLLLISFAFGLAGLFIIVKTLHKQTIVSLTTARTKIDWKRIWFAFFFWGIISSGLVLVDYFLNPAGYEYNFEFNRFIILAVIAILLIPIQTSLEEYIFRGYLMQGFGMLAKNRWFPLILTSLIFGMLHIANPEVEKLGYSIMIYYIGTGLFLGVITLMDEGMELALGFHAANNLFTALLVTANWTAFQTHSILKDTAEPSLEFIDLVLPVFIIFPLLLLIFGKVYKWTNWKDKLFGKIEDPASKTY
ncbi:CPBP family intramembrane glutamic endopeptidase [Lacinutrix sp. Hel_I_90]|uniref:CPBP family intramembrane glutamic endopeptidase n=1 Tax=Lacinutrix sp. Hel_I_90 TaxID=1249999 RepID=UPI0005CACDDC|nr:CPBP family intramembrane glutamic endopeptidase [Lacinutrix sp. Hel_I_90]